MAADEAAAYQEALREAFRSATPLEPAVAARRPTPHPKATPGAKPARTAAAEAPDAGPPTSPPLSAATPVAAATPGSSAPLPAAIQARRRVSQSAAAPTSPVAPTPVVPMSVVPTPVVPTPSPRPPIYPQAGGPPANERAGVRVRTVFILVVAGSVVGLVSGALVVGAALAPRTAEPVGTPSAVPSATVAPSVGPAANLPDGVAAGILQVATVNERLAGAATDLAAVLKARNPSAAQIAPLLRKIADDARSGEQGARRVAAWTAAGSFPATVLALYDAAATVAEDGLGAPLSDDAAYAAAGRRMLTALDSLPAIAAATSEIAGRAGIVLLDAVPTPQP